VAGYRSWKDLVERPAPAQAREPELVHEQAPGPETSAASEATPSATEPTRVSARAGLEQLGELLANRVDRPAPTLDQLLEQGLLPDELAKALRQYHSLRRQLDHLTGRGEADPEAERRRRSFPVDVHSKTTRIAQRRAWRSEEQLRQAIARAQQDLVAEQKQAEREAERRDLRTRNARVTRALRARARTRHRAARLEQRLGDRQARAQRSALLDAHLEQVADTEREQRERAESRRRIVQQVIASRRAVELDELDQLRRRAAQRALSNDERLARARELERQEERQRLATLVREQAIELEARARARLEDRLRSAIERNEHERRRASEALARLDQRRRAAAAERERARQLEQAAREQLDRRREEAAAQVRAQARAQQDDARAREASRQPPRPRPTPRVHEGVREPTREHLPEHAREQQALDRQAQRRANEREQARLDEQRARALARRRNQETHG